MMRGKEFSIEEETLKSERNQPFAIYTDECNLVAMQSMCRWNRDIASSSCGSFDRSWWGWKASDFSDASLQAAITLVIKVAEQKHWGGLMPELLPRYVAFLERVQHSDGSFDQCYPNEKTPGVFYDILPALLTVHGSSWLDVSSRDRIEKIITKGMDFAMSADEMHGEIANHLAHFAYGLLLYWEKFGDSRSLLRAKAYIARILRNFDEEEGWFQEYHGPDAGYQTRTLAYITRAAEILKDETLWDVCARAARFIELMLMPDGSLHPMLGVRSTALIYPSGFERLAARDSTFQSLAKRIRAAWSNNRVALPSQLDFNNALRLGEDAWHAAEVASRASRISKLSAEPISQTEIPPYGVTHLQRAGILIRRDDNTMIWLGWRLGGALVVWQKVENGSWRLVHENSGYVLEGGLAGQWLTRMPDAGRLIEQEPDRLLVEVSFHRASHEELTPVKLILLRLLNLTLIRFQLTGDFFRKLLVGRLTGKGASLSVKMFREISFGANSIQVVDSFQGGKNLPGELAAASLWRCRRVTGNHMASSRYYQILEGALSEPWIELQSESLVGDPTFSYKIIGENV